MTPEETKQRLVFIRADEAACPCSHEPRPDYLCTDCFLLAQLDAADERFGDIAKRRHAVFCDLNRQLAAAKAEYKIALDHNGHLEQCVESRDARLAPAETLADHLEHAVYCRENVDGGCGKCRDCVILEKVAAYRAGGGK